jgi:hypothetical protein
MAEDQANQEKRGALYGAIGTVGLGVAGAITGGLALGAAGILPGLNAGMSVGRAATGGK